MIFTTYRPKPKQFYENENHHTTNNSNVKQSREKVLNHSTLAKWLLNQEPKNIDVRTSLLINVNKPVRNKTGLSWRKPVINLQTVISSLVLKIYKSVQIADLHIIYRSMKNKKRTEISQVLSERSDMWSVWTMDT